MYRLRLWRFLVVLGAVLIGGWGSIGQVAHAIEASVPDPSQSISSHESDALIPPPTVSSKDKVVSLDDGAYEPLTFETLLNLFWKARVLDPEKRSVLNDYIHLTSCDLYNEFYHDDFKWPQIMSTTRDYIKAYRDHYPSQVSIVQPIDFERYNVEKEWFALTSSTQYLNVSKMQIANFGRDKTNSCDDGYITLNIPTKAVIQLNVPFSITYVHMTPDEAKDYLAYIAQAGPQKKQVNLEENDRLSTEKNSKSTSVAVVPGGRYAYVRFNYTVLGVLPQKDPLATPNFVGRLDSYTIAADREITKVLQHWKNKNIQRDALDFAPSNARVLQRAIE